LPSSRPREPELPPPEAWGPALRLARIARRPLEKFLQIQAASGILLIVCAVIALVVASSRFGASYAHFWHLPVGIQVGSYRFERPLEWVVNDGLMAIFFFVVGIEIRREIHQGELSEWRRAALPFAAALGGMIAPAVIYAIVARAAPEAHRGWGVPMATDIAFAVGVLTLLGKRVPPALRVLLLALAVIDDLGAIVVIAIFYSKGISASGLAVAGIGLFGIFLLRTIGVRQKLAYVVPAVVLWAGTYMVGVHPTIAGVIVGMLTPVRAWLGTEGAREGLKDDVAVLSRSGEDISSQELAQVLRHVDTVRRETLSPAESLIETLHPWVAFVIMPIFALANAGVAVTGVSLTRGSTLALVGAAIGLFVGKPVGVLVASFVVVKARLASLPRGLGARHLVVLGFVAGVGFTMALFVAQLAFVDEAMLAAVKMGVLGASAAAAGAALVLGRVLLPKTPQEPIAETADEAEASTEA
jgi:NhaA family Na+:H+ antiporter